MTHQDTKQVAYTSNTQASQATVMSSVTSNPRIMQLDTLLNRSRFIWAREQSQQVQQASNNN